MELAAGFIACYAAIARVFMVADQLSNFIIFLLFQQFPAFLQQPT